MGVPGNANALLLRSAAAAGGYQVSRSLRFNSADSAHLSRAFSSTGNQKTATFSFWLKRTTLSTVQYFYDSSSTNTTVLFGLDGSDDKLSGNLRGTGGTNYFWSTNAVFRDPSAWYHVIIVFDTTQATAANRLKVYVNGTEQSFSSVSYCPQDTLLFTNDTRYIGQESSVYGLFNGYLADIWFLDGIAATPSDFAETDATTGQWIPKAYTGSKGTNGFHLEFADNSAATATTLGKDTANSNNWTPNNFSVTAGAGNDSLVDTPTSYGTDTGAGGEVRGNYATLNPLWCNSAITLSNGNLDLSSTSTAWKSVSSTVAIPTSGKWYFEVLQTVATDYLNVGVVPVGFTLSSYPGSTATSWAWQSHANKWNNNTGTSWGSTTTNGDIIMIAVDRDSGKIWAGKNGTWFSSGNPASGTNEMFSGLGSELLVPAIGAYSTTSCAMNFGARAFSYQAPSGFKALVDTNLTAPVIAKPNTVFDTVLWTGNGASTRTITTNSVSSPDLVWIKNRSASGWFHQVMDSVRGNDKYLSTNSTNEELSSNLYGWLSEIVSNGFVVKAGATDDNNVNDSSSTYVGWVWDAGSSTVTNTQGSISGGSQVRANPSSGFSVVTWVGDGTGTTRTVGHGLGVAPSLIIAKNRTSVDGWPVYHKDLGNSQIVYLNTTAAASTNTAVWNSTSPTSTVFSIGGTGLVNELNYNYVAYCFAPVAGYSSFGSYTGNGSADGPAIWLGFRPALLIIKNSSATNNWVIFDSKRDGYNVNNDQLYPNTSAAEDDGLTYTFVDLLSNGFKLRNTATDKNGSGGTYIYCAWAESPFQYARAR